MVPTPIILGACLILVVYFVFITEASLKGKGVVLCLFILSLASYTGWIPVHPLFGMLLQVGLSIFIILYRKWHSIM